MKTDHSRATADGAHSHAIVPDESRATRKLSFDLADFPVPAGREEDWRFTPITRFPEMFHTEYDGEIEVRTEAPEGVLVETVEGKPSAESRVGAPGDRSAVAAWNAHDKHLRVTIPANLEAPGYTSIEITGTGTDKTAQSHISVSAGENSSGIVIIDHRGAARLNQTLETEVRDGANLTLVSVQDWADGALHLASHRNVVGRDAKLKHIVVTLGGDLVRINLDSGFSAPRAEVELLGLYFTDSGQHQEHRLLVDHSYEKCLSRVTYKGALQGEGAHAVWVGDVLIRKEAEGTDTYELNRNLLLTTGARADSVPNLEIETGEIEGAGHASATGRFDDEQLFYLMSRGIAEADARRLVVRGFFAELINMIGVPEVQERLNAAIEAELGQTMENVQS